MADAVNEEQVQECVEEDDGSPSLITWQARDAAAVARQPHPCPLPQALFAPDILLPPQQAAALAGGAAPPKRPPSKPFLAFMEGLGALQCVSQSGVVPLDIERIFPLGPCNDSLRSLFYMLIFLSAPLLTSVDLDGSCTTSQYPLRLRKIKSRGKL